MPEHHEESRQKTVLITGGAGYLGSVLVPIYLQAGHRVKVLDCFIFGEDALAPVKDHPNLVIIRDDILNHENHPDLFKGVDTVVHLASVSNDPSCDLDPNLTIRTNFFTTIAIARRAKIDGVRRFIFMSSCSVYGGGIDDQLLTETSQTGPLTLYAMTKLESEHSLLPLHSEGFCITIFRLATLFGLSRRMRFDLAINVMTKRALQGHDMVVNGLGNQYRPFLHVRDAAETIFEVSSMDPNKVGGRVFNVGRDDMNYKIIDLAKELCTHFPGIDLQIVEANNDPRSYNVSFKKIREELGIIPKRVVSDAVEEIKTAYQCGELKDLDNQRYYNLALLKNADSSHTNFYSPASTQMWADVLPKSKNSTSAAVAAQSGVVVPMRSRSEKKEKIVAMILAYNCGKMLPRAYERIPKHLVDDIIVMDDGSKDNTSEVAKSLGLKVFRNPKNLGYGGNVKAGLKKAMEMGADYIVEIHGDGAQFNPVSIEFALPHIWSGADFILGSRFLERGKARENGMPLIRFVANRFLSFFDRIVLKLPLTEFHTGFRIYSRKMLETVPFESNSNDYLFSFQIIAQAAYYRMKVEEVPVEADYRSEHTSNSLRGASIYAIQTFFQLGNFVLARLKIRNNSIFPRVNSLVSPAPVTDNQTSKRHSQTGS